MPMFKRAREIHSGVIPGRSRSERTRNPDAYTELTSGFRVYAHSASKMRVNALVGAPRNDRGECCDFLRRLGLVDLALGISRGRSVAAHDRLALLEREHVVDIGKA